MDNERRKQKGRGNRRKIYRQFLNSTSGFALDKLRTNFGRDNAGNTGCRFLKTMKQLQTSRKSLIYRLFFVFITNNTSFSIQKLELLNYYLITSNIYS